MELIKIREVSGAKLAELAARTKDVVGITNNRVLVGVLVPANQYWIQHVLAQNQTRVEQSLAEGEQVASSSSLRSLHSVLADDGSNGPPGHAASPADPNAEDRSAPRLPLIGGEFLSVAALDSFVERVRSLLPSRLTAQASSAGQESGIGRSRRVRLGELTGRLIDQAGAQGDTLVITNDRVLTGVLLPVTPSLVEQLIEQNLSRVFYNIERGEQHARDAGLVSVERAAKMPVDIITTQGGSS